MKCDFEVFYGNGIILLEDLNKGEMSVTNAIENIIKYIKQELKGHPEPDILKYKILARDSEGNWDEVILYNDGKFSCFHNSLVGHTGKRNDK